MATTTPNFGWPVPTSTDLVKDGAVAIEGLGDAIDASLLDLKGGTTGQVLAKASNTDMDFTWATDASGIPATIFDAKGDIIAATAADTASRLAVGANDTVLTADSSTATGLKWATASSGGMTVIASGSIGSVATFSFSSISQTYKNLQLNINNWSTASGRTLTLAINGATNQYASVWLSYGGTGNQRSNSANAYVPIGTGIFGTATGDTVITFPNYTATCRKQGHYLEFDDDGSGALAPIMGAWGRNGSAAITSITIGLNGSGNFSAGTYELLGIK